MAIKINEKTLEVAQQLIDIYGFTTDVNTVARYITDWGAINTPQGKKMYVKYGIETYLLELPPQE